MKVLENGNYIRKISNSIFYEIFQKYQLNFNELSIILFLNENKTEKNTAKDIVEELLFTKSHVSTSVESLVNKKYIIRQSDKQDKKKIHLILTEKANIVLSDAEMKKEEFKKIVLENITDEEKEIGEKIFMKICNNIKKYYDEK